MSSRKDDRLEIHGPNFSNNYSNFCEIGSRLAFPDFTFFFFAHMPRVIAVRCGGNAKQVHVDLSLLIDIE